RSVSMKPKKPTSSTNRRSKGSKAQDAPEVIEVSGEVVDESIEHSDDSETDLDDDEEDVDPDEADVEVIASASFGDSFDEDLDDSIDEDPGTAIVVNKKRDSLARSDPLQAYMREVQAHPLLTPEEERSLAIRYTETQDVNAAARLVTANLRLVVKLAYEYRRAYRNMMDLIQEGNMGLMQAVKKYDPYRGVKLASYAAWWIRGYMLRYILAKWRRGKVGT